jgi:hypothetical protein
VSNRAIGTLLTADVGLNNLLEKLYPKYLELYLILSELSVLHLEFTED